MQKVCTGRSTDNKELKPFGKKVWEQFFNALRSIQQQISFDINGNPVWGLGLGNFTNPVITLEEIFSYLNSADKPCLVAIDKFQKITEYPNGKNIEAALRTHIQRCPNATFLFCGSKPHLMTEIFLSPSRPFYQSVVTMGLDAISKEKYTEFAIHQFESNGKKLDADIVEQIYDRFDGVTAYLQRIMNVLFLNTSKGKRCKADMIEDAIDFIIDLNYEPYEMLFCHMSEKQRIVFLAIAMEKGAQNISSSQFVRKYRLSSPSSVVSAVRGLLEKDFVTQENNTYYVYDHFFQIWLEKRNYINRT